jgi:Predicted signal transduction protein with a C-terminal ATPase domain
MLIFSFLLFSWVKNIISEKYSESALQSICENTENIDFIMNDINEFSNLILTNSDFANLLKRKNDTDTSQIENFLRDFFASRGDIEGLCVYSGQNMYLIGANKVVKRNDDTDWFKELLKTHGEVKWINTRNEKIKIMAGDFDKYYFSLGRKIIDLYSLKELGVLVIDINENILEKTYNRFIKQGDISVFICDQKGNIISHPDKSKIGTNISENQLYEEVLSGKSDYGKFSYKSNKLDEMVLYSTCRVTGWKLIQIIPTSYLYNEIDKIKNIVYAIGIIYFFISLIIALFLSVKFTGPMRRLMKKMKLAEDGNLDVQISVENKDEVGQLGISFNNMIIKIKSLIEKIVDEERVKKEIELEALHAQINPHFLYNTLNSIKWMAKIQGANNITSTVTALIKLLHVSISLSNEMILLEDEIEYVRSYILIQKVRFNERFEVTYSIDENCGKCNIPKLILQPIVENSIIYGYQDNIEMCLDIEIKANCEGDLLIIQVIDNGPGIEDSILEKIFSKEKNVNKFSRVGLNNINQRIKLYFGERYGISINSVKAKGTCVKLILPYSADVKEVKHVQSINS